MTAEREMTLDEWCARLHESHLVNRQLRDLRAALSPAELGGVEAVGMLSVSKYRGYLENTSFDYIGNLPDGTYRLYATPRAVEAVSEEVETRLFDSQWVNIVNHANCYRGMSVEDAVAKAVKLTEQAMAANVSDAKWPSKQAKAALTPPSAKGE